MRIGPVVTPVTADAGVVGGADSPDCDAAALPGFIIRLAALLETKPDEIAFLSAGAGLLADLVKRDNWLPQAYAAPSDRYRQYLLHRDRAQRFSVVSFVWGPGQATPIHDHRTWGMVGVLRGAELVQRYARQQDGSLQMEGPPQRVEAGQVDWFTDDGRPSSRGERMRRSSLGQHPATPMANFPSCGVSEASRESEVISCTIERLDARTRAEPTPVAFPPVAGAVVS